MLGRLHLLRGELEDARRILDETLDFVAARGLTAFQSWPQSFRGELDLLDGDVDAAEQRPRTRLRPRLPGRRSLLGKHRGARPRARRGRAGRRRLGPGAARRSAEALPPPPRHVSLDRGVLTGRPLLAGPRAGVRGSRAVDRRARGDRPRHGMRELLARATIYRARLGEPGALDAARSLAGRSTIRCSASCSGRSRGSPRPAESRLLDDGPA